METNYYEYFNEYFTYEDYRMVYTEEELENDFRVFENILKNVYKIGRN